MGQCPRTRPFFQHKNWKIPCRENIMSAQERARFLPVMKALLKVMKTKTAAPSDVNKNIGGQPHIMTNFGAFPLSDVSLMTDAERQQFLPSVETFISVLEKDNLDASEMNTLLAQSRELTNLIPSNLLNQFGGGLNGLAGFGK